MQYIVDDSGTRTSVIVPYEKWEKLNSDYRKLQKKLDVLLSIKKGINEIKIAEKQRKNLQTLSEFLSESCN